MSKYAPKETLAFAITTLISNLLLQQDVPPAISTSLGGIAGAVVKDFGFKQKTKPVPHRLTTALRDAMSSALDSPEFELPNMKAKESLLNIFSPENAVSYLQLDNPTMEVKLEFYIRTILVHFDECDLTTLPIDAILSNTLDSLEQTIQNDPSLAGLATYLNTKKNIEISSATLQNTETIIQMLKNSENIERKNTLDDMAILDDIVIRIPYEKLHFGMQVGMQLARLEWFWDSTLEEAKAEFEPTKERIITFLSPDNFTPDCKDYKSFSQSLLSFYTAYDLEKLYSILMGISYMRTVIFGVALNKEEMRDLAFSSLRSIPSNILSNKTTLFKFFTANSKTDFYEILDMLYSITEK